MAEHKFCPMCGCECATSKSFAASQRELMDADFVSANEINALHDRIWLAREQRRLDAETYKNMIAASQRENEQLRARISAVEKLLAELRAIDSYEAFRDSLNRFAHYYAELLADALNPTAAEKAHE